VDLHDGVVDIDDHRARVRHAAEQLGVLGEVEQEPEATASACRTCPKRNERRNDPNVEARRRR
jgi:hypothetical protein